MNVRILFLVVLAFMFANIVFAGSHLPPGLLKAQEDNAILAEEFLRNISFFIAFLAGMTSILSPCILPLLPAYFAITFKEKKKITLATFIFFLGFAVIFILMGLLATLTGNTLITIFRGINWLVPLAGLFLILFGIMIFLGKGFSGFMLKRRYKGDKFGVFISGSLFAIGWTACIGPILSGVLLMTAVFRNYATASYLMLAYSLGLFVPLFILSFFYDKMKLNKLRWLHKEFIIKIYGKRYYSNIPNIIAGLLFFIIGLIFIIFRGTWIFNSLQMFGLREYFYRLQNLFLDNSTLFNKVGVIVFIIFFLILIFILAGEIKNRRTRAQDG
jgi:cytochrome c-type biogenesis protein